jgi:multiple sugar transport system substrate-binding protein
MSTQSKISRRQFLKIAGMTVAGSFLAACTPSSRPVTQVPVSMPTAATTQVPTLIKPHKVTVQVDTWAVTDTNKLLATPLYQDFNQQTGIEINFIPRPGYKDATLKDLELAVEAGTSPYDIIDFEDELTTTFSQRGYMAPLNDLLPADFWNDFPPAMQAYSNTWSTRSGELFRVVHNWEMPYWWYRKDWFDQKGVAVPTTWEEVRGLGKVFTDEARGVWASEDTLIKGGYLNVYLSWITLQAGGNPFEVGAEYQAALEYIYDLMHADKVLNPYSLQTQILQLNADYVADKIAFMRDWPFLYDTAHSPDNAAWFNEDKIAIAMPPVGPGGKGNSTYAACWGFGLVKTAPNLAPAREVFKFLVSPDVAAAMAHTSVWYVSARKSVLASVGDQGIAKAMKRYTDADIVAVRPYHPRFFEAIKVLEDVATPFLTDQITLDECLKQTRENMAKLA